MSSSSDLFVFDNNFFSDPFTPPQLHDQELLFQEFPEEVNVNTTLIHQENISDETKSNLDKIATVLLSSSSSSPSSSSPPSHQLESLSISQTTPLYAEYSAALDVKAEDCQAPFESFYTSFVASQSCPSEAENAVKKMTTMMMQRSLSSDSFDGKPCNFSYFQPRFDTLVESPNLHENNGFLLSGQMRRVCSTGDLQKMKSNESRNTLSSSPLSKERSFMEEANIKVGRYSAEERKERIHRYRAKRNQRNFNKTIKYACRKTLADNRPRIRGRFARNDEAGEIPKTANFNRYEDEEDIWIEGMHEEEESSFFNSYGSTTTSATPTHYQYFSY